MAQKPQPAKKPFNETPVFYDALKEAGLTERQFKEQTGRPEMPEELKDIDWGKPINAARIVGNTRFIDTSAGGNW